MKLLVALCMLPLVVASVVAQSKHIIRVHAFSQEVIPGVAPAVSDGEVYKPQKRYNYQIFIECKPSTRLSMSSIRVNGKRHAATLEEVESPVTQFHATTLQQDTLIQKTSNKILKVNLGNEIASSKTRDTIGVAFSYFVKGKSHSFARKKFKELVPLAMP